METGNKLIDEIIKQINILDNFYVIEYQNGDAKALDGMEKCIELKMKCYGIDGKNTPEINIHKQNSIVNPELLSENTLLEIINIIKTNSSAT